ncbi:hypothetical protein McanMca71_004146 [Microsporum canis]|uniref:Uncharacterized protein n=1 Tax=Arthroderma otae (strain ATCC MYA-4605 / CBS 113480) TaxID=554155 RepID=C5FRI7_ARTOC|nr:uncharacterized protein MCYG_05309 [Microsporum canis CBS 113480]EEQ32490.1 predicted protein [Microsporum canis CBS 113480]
MPMQHSLDMELITAAARYADENRSRRNIHTNLEGVIGHARTDSSIYGSGNSASPDVPTPPTEGATAGFSAATADPAPSGAETAAEGTTYTTVGNVNSHAPSSTAKTTTTDATQSHS